MEKYEILKNSIYKNIQELAEFLIDNFNISNYYDLIDYIINLHNFKVKTLEENKSLAYKIIKELEKEN